MAAPPGNVLPPGTLELEFKGIRLHGWASDLSDDIQWRIASHEFDRRAGGQTENMNRAPSQARVTLVFVGEQGFLDAQAFLLALEINPSGLFVHPIYGKSQRTCVGTQGARLEVAAVNTYTMPVVFIENNLDASVIGEQDQGVSAKSLAVTAQSATLTELSSSYTSAVASVQAFTDAVAVFTDEVAATLGGIVDSGLVALMSSLPDLAGAAIEALQAASELPEVALAVQAAEGLLAQATALGDAILAQRPPLRPQVISSPIAPVVLAERLYGADAFDRLEELFANNPEISGLVEIPAGFKMKVAPGTVE